MKDFAAIDWSAMTGYYPVLNPRIELHRSAIGGLIVYSVLSGTKGHRFTGEFQSLETEGFMIDYLSRCDGAHSHADIAREMAKLINPMMGPALALRALETAVGSGFVELSKSPVPRDPIKMTGSARSFQPQHLSIEIIETCNFNCDHCYYSSSPYKTGILALEDAKRILDTARDSGVRVVELTGGECTIHPNFREILQHAHDNFGLVAVISNGYRLGTDPDLADFVGGLERVMVQISIDGLADHHDRFRKHKNAFAACEAAVKRLVALGCPVRIAMTVTDDNTDDIVPMYRNAKAWGAIQIAFAPVASIGRGCNISDAGAGSARLVKTINEVLAPFDGDPIFGEDAAKPIGSRYVPGQNCGAGWRTFAVDYDGNVRACNYSRNSKMFGNLLTDDFEAVFAQRANYLFNNAPPPGTEECRGCAYFFNCKGCFVKAFMVSETEYPDCPWRAKWFPDMPLALDPDRTPVAGSAAVLAGLPQGDKTALAVCMDCGRVGEH